MKMSLSILFVMVLTLLAFSACAQQPAQPQASAPPPVEPTSTQPAPTLIPVDGGPVVTTAVVGGSIDLSQITPAPVNPTPPDPAAGGPQTVTLNDQGKTITLASGESFLLKLGETYTWDITISDQNVISRVKNIAVILGAQGVYQGLKPGTVTLSATGDPLCRQSKPACGQPSIQFTVTIVVK